MRHRRQKLLTSQVLENALAILGHDGERWTKGAYARNSSEHWVPTMDARAECWCPGGAICRALSGDLGGKQFDAAMAELQFAAGMRSIPAWNDDRKTTFEDISAAFVKAIACCKFQEITGYERVAT